MRKSLFKEGHKKNLHFATSHPQRKESAFPICNICFSINYQQICVGLSQKIPVQYNNINRDLLVFFVQRTVVIFCAAQSSLNMTL